MVSSDSLKTFARREARPIPWDRLSDDQQSAIARTARILADIGEQPSSRSDTSPRADKHLDMFLPAVDSERLNHVILLDGERGSGKTALLVTLLDAWNRMLRGRANELQDGLRNALQDTKMVVPIGLIDLQPLPRSTNLLLYLVGRFQRVVEAIEQVHVDRSTRRQAADHRRGERSPWQGTSADEPKSTVKWREFLQAAALGWTNDGLDRRRANLDPEAFVHELEQAERRRLDVVSSFRALIDALVDEYELLDALPKKNPLFLLAIDDADMNPEKCEELLDLVRTLWHRRVAFVLTGDSKLFMATLRHRLKDSIDDQEFVGDLVADIYNKLIPPAHRFTFPRLPPKTRFERLRESLHKLRSPAGPVERHFPWLDELFEASEQAKEMLPSRERALADLRVRIEMEIAADNAPEGKQYDATLRVIAALCRAALWPWREQRGEHLPELGHEEDVLQTAILTRSFVWLASTKNARYLPNDVDWKLVAQRTPRFDALMADGKEVPINVVAVSMLARDAAEGLLRHRPTLAPIQDLGLLGAVVRLEYTTEGETYSFAWPSPAWPSFAEYIAFGKRWKTSAPEHESFHEDDIDGLAFRFIDALVLFLGGKTTKEGEWRLLANEVAVLANSEDAVTSHWALARAGLLAAPESGLGPTAANAWLEALKDALGTRWEEARVALKKERRARVYHVTQKGVQQAGKVPHNLLARIDKKYESAKYRWNELVEQEVEATRITLAPLLKLLEEIPTPFGPPGRGTLAAYFEVPSRRRVLEESVSPPRLDALLKAVEPYRGRQDGAAEALVSLWEAGCALSSTPPEGVVLEGGKIFMPFLGDKRPILEFDAEVGRSSDAGRNIAGYRIGRLRLKGVEGRPELQNVLLRVMFDVKVDMEDRAGATPPPAYLPWWPGVGTYAQSAFNGYRWPTPGWPAAYEWESAFDAWHEIEAMGRPMFSNPRAVDGLAFWLLLCVTSLFKGVPVRAEFRNNPSPGSFLMAILSALEDRPREVKSARDRAYADWCDKLPLFWAPESGLSNEIAHYFFQIQAKQVHVKPGQEEVSKLLADKNTLRQARVERARESGVEESQIDRELAAIDTAMPDHPWVRYIGPHKAS